MKSQTKSQLRQADLTDASMIAHLMNMVSGGALAIKFGRDADNDETWLDVARQTISRTDSELSYTNCIVYEINGDVAGMMLLNWLGAEMPEIDFSQIEEEARPANELIAQVPNTLLIRELGVLEKYRRRGVAEALLKLAQDYARSKNIPALSLTVHETSSNARRLYTKIGFEPVNARAILKHEIWDVGSQLYLMVKHLN
jgi:ribosomal protein S18 acetylase RimI-like enzyme